MSRLYWEKNTSLTTPRGISEVLKCVCVNVVSMFWWLISKTENQNPRETVLVAKVSTSTAWSGEKKVGVGIEHLTCNYSPSNQPWAHRLHMACNATAATEIRTPPSGANSGRRSGSNRALTTGRRSNPALYPLSYRGGQTAQMSWDARIWVDGTLSRWATE